MKQFLPPCCAIDQSGTRRCTKPAVEKYEFGVCSLDHKQQVEKAAPKAGKGYQEFFASAAETNPRISKKHILDECQKAHTAVVNYYDSKLVSAMNAAGIATVEAVVETTRNLTTAMTSEDAIRFQKLRAEAEEAQQRADEALLASGSTLRPKGRRSSQPASSKRSRTACKSDDDEEDEEEEEAAGEVRELNEESRPSGRRRSVQPTTRSRTARDSDEEKVEEAGGGLNGGDEARELNEGGRAPPALQINMTMDKIPAVLPRIVEWWKRNENKGGMYTPPDYLELLGLVEELVLDKPSAGRSE